MQARSIDKVVLAESALASLPNPALVLRGDGSVLFANQAATSLSQVLSQEPFVAVLNLVKACLETGRSHSDRLMLPGRLGPMLLDVSLLPCGEDQVLMLVRDITLESNLRSTLVESRQRYKDLVEISSDFAWELDDEGRFIFVSPRGALGHRADQLIGHQPEEFLVEQPGVDGLLPFHSMKPQEEVEIWMRKADGQAACLLVSSSPLLNNEGLRRGVRGVCRDVTGERARDAALARAHNRERLISYIVQAIRDVVDPAEILSAAVEATVGALGAAGGQVFRYDASRFIPAASYGIVTVATEVLAVLASQDVFIGQIEGRLALAAVTRHHHKINGSVVLWREADGIPWGEDEQAMLNDVANQIGLANEQIANHERIVTLSRTDALTGLFNRRAFFEELSRRFTRLARDNRSAALIYVDLDNFKAVNDVHGHKRGDEALQAVRDILIRHSRPIDLVARLGGDEFAIWLEGADKEIAIRRCQEILDAASELSVFSGSPDRRLTLSLGVAVHEPSSQEHQNDLLARADAAMYAVKRQGKGTYRLAENEETVSQGGTP